MRPRHAGCLGGSLQEARDEVLREACVQARDALEERAQLAPVRDEGGLALVLMLEAEVGRVDRLVRERLQQRLQMRLVLRELLGRVEELAQPADVRVQEGEGRLRRLELVRLQAAQQQRDGLPEEQRRLRGERRGLLALREGVPAIEQLEGDARRERGERRGEGELRGGGLGEHAHDVEPLQVGQLVGHVHALEHHLGEAEARPLMQRGLAAHEGEQPLHDGGRGDEPDVDPRDVVVHRAQARCAQRGVCRVAPRAVVELQDRRPRLGQLRETVRTHRVLDAGG
mmetsp:Transcript_19270/g.48445  ORF Transcript_19270/g.48445 Transcript_19270/m.48445 type:complete len:284 (-) Transcript_19270:581-1432(-)